jgi:hypothetical protein
MADDGLADVQWDESCINRDTRYRQRLSILHGHYDHYDHYDYYDHYDHYDDYDRSYLWVLQRECGTSAVLRESLRHHQYPALGR